MSPSSPSSLNPFAASFFPPNKSLLQPHASSSACDVASLASIFSQLISPNISSFSLEHLVLAVISAFSHGIRASQLPTATQPSHPHPSPLSQSPESPCDSSPVPVPASISSSKFEFSALKGVSKSAVSGHPLIAPALNTTNTNTAAFRTSPKPAQTHSSPSPSSSFSSSSWKTVSPKRHSHTRKPAVSPTLNTIPESKSIPLKNSFAALATECEEPESNNATDNVTDRLHLVPIPVSASVTVPTQSVQTNRPSASITLNTNCTNALVEKKDNSSAQTSHSSSTSSSSSSSSSSSPSQSPSVKFNPELSKFDGFPQFTNLEMLKIPFGQLRFERKQIEEHLEDYRYWLKENRCAFTKEQLDHHSKQLILLSKYQTEVKHVLNSRWKAEVENVAR